MLSSEIQFNELPPELQCWGSGIGCSERTVVGFVKVVAWYDNEWGYSNKCLEMVRVIAK